MNGKDFLELSMRTDGKNQFYQDLGNKLEDQASSYPQFHDPKKPKGLQLIHAVMGLAGEVGEVTDAIKKHILYNRELDITNVKEECGDILWYMALLLKEINSSFEEVMEMNVLKLRLRYPEGYTDLAAIERKDKLPIMDPNLCKHKFYSFLSAPNVNDAGHCEYCGFYSAEFLYGKVQQ